MTDTIEIKKETLQQLKDSYAKYYQYEKLELDKKKITKLRKKITAEKKEGHTHLLRVISLYTQEKDEHLKIYISKLYLQHFEN